MNPPLAEQLRPQRLEEYIGQTHLMGRGAVLEKAILSGNLPSMILWGPPGVGKTTLAYLISKYLDRPFFTLSAVLAGVKDVRAVLDNAERMQKSTALLDSPSLFENPAPRSRNMQNKRPILFIDEIHRFSKSQHDALLGAASLAAIC